MGCNGVMEALGTALLGFRFSISIETRSCYGEGGSYNPAVKTVLGGNLTMPGGIVH